MNNIVLNKFKFNLILDTILLGTTFCDEFNYQFEYEVNEGFGKAYLKTINNTAVNIRLYSLDLTKNFVFISDMPPTLVTVNGKEVYIFRILLDINPKTNERKALVIYHKDASFIHSTINWENAHSRFVPL